MRKVVTALVGALLTSQVAAQPVSQPPKLIVAISVDQFSADLYDEYRPHFTAGLKRLSSGAAFRNGYQSHNATETCPGHSTILTGSHPSRTGIIANGWYDLSQARSDKSVYCVEDERVPGSSSIAYTVSPYHLRVPTMGDRLKAVSPASRNVAVAGKDRSAVMMGGRAVDQRWFWDGKTFSTDLKGVATPRSVAAGKLAVANAIAQDRPPLELPEFCQGKAKNIPIEGYGSPVGANRFARKAGDVRSFRASPEFDGATLALAAALIDEMQLGHGTATDIISIGLSGTDIIGHGYGTEGAEMCLQLLSIDRDLGDFLRLLDRRGIDYLVMLTADHGGQDVPERRRQQGVSDAARVDPNLTAKDVGAAVGAQLGLKGPVLYGEGSFGDMYVDRALSPGDRARAKSAAVAMFRAHPQVEAVFTHEQLAATPVPTESPTSWSLIQRARASFDAERSGDFIVLLKRDVNAATRTPGYVATHGSPWDYDRRVPILFWRQGMPSLALDSPVETTDILPTLAATVGLAIPAGSIDGHCLAAVAGDRCTLR